MTREENPRKPKPNEPTDVKEPSNVRPPGEPVPEKRPPSESAGGATGDEGAAAE